MDQDRYHEKKLAQRIVFLADQCRGDVGARLRRAGFELDKVAAAEVGLLIGHAIREGMLTGRSFERWVVGRRQAPANAGKAPATIGIPPLPKATTAADPEFDADETTCMRCHQPWRRCECRKQGA